MEIFTTYRYDLKQDDTVIGYLDVSYYSPYYLNESDFSFSGFVKPDSSGGGESVQQWLRLRQARYLQKAYPFRCLR